MPETPDDEMVRLRLMLGHDAWRLRSQYADMFDYARDHLGTLSARFPDMDVIPQGDDDLLCTLAGQHCAPYIQKLSDDEAILDISHVIAGAAGIWEMATLISDSLPQFRDVTGAMLTNVLLHVAAINHVMFQITVADLDDDTEFHTTINAHLNHPAYPQTNSGEEP